MAPVISGVKWWSGDMEMTTSVISKNFVSNKKNENAHSGDMGVMVIIEMARVVMPGDGWSGIVEVTVLVINQKVEVIFAHP